MKVTKQTKDQKKSTQNNGKTTQKRVAKKTTYVYKVHSTQEPQPKIYNPSSSSYQRQGNFSGNFQKNQQNTSNRVSKIITYDLSNYATNENLEKIIFIQKWWREIYARKFLVDNNDFVDQVNYTVTQNQTSNNKYIVETKKVELFKKIGNNFNESCKLSKEELRYHMRNLWNEENSISTTASLFCESDFKKQLPENELIISYEEEIRELKRELLAKNEELYNYINNSNDQRIKYCTCQNAWLDFLIPSPVNELLIESYKYREPLKMQNLGCFSIFNDYSKNVSRMDEEKIEILNQEENNYEENNNLNNYYNLQNRKKINFYENYPLEIQKVNELSIFNEFMRMSSEKLCQQLGGLMILGREQPELLLQKIDELRISCSHIKTKPTIQELDGLEIIKDTNLPNPKEPLLQQNVNEMYIYSLKNNKINNQIQELDGIEIWGMQKEPLYAQGVDSLKISANFKNNNLNNYNENLYPEIVDNIEIARDYDMLLVKPVWNSLEIQGSGLNLLSCTKDKRVETQEINEFSETKYKKVENLNENLEKIPKKIRIIVPIPENFVEKLDNFQICVAEKFSTPICAENVDALNISKAYSTRIFSSFENLQISENNLLNIIGEKKEEPVKEEPVVKEEKIEKIEKTEEIIEKEEPVKEEPVVEEEEKEEEKEEKKVEYVMENINNVDILGESKNWNLINQPIKTTKMIVRATKKNNEIASENFVLRSFPIESFASENFAFNIEKTEIAKPKEQALIPGTLFDIMIEGTKPEIVLPYTEPVKTNQFLILSESNQKNWNQENRPNHEKNIEIFAIEKKLPTYKSAKGDKFSIEGVPTEPQIQEVPRDWNKFLSVFEGEVFDIIREPYQKEYLKIDWNKVNNPDEQSIFNIIREKEPLQEVYIRTDWNKKNEAETEVIINIIRQEGMRAIPDREPEPAYKSGWNELDIENESSVAFIKKVKYSDGMQCQFDSDKLNFAKENEVTIIQEPKSKKDSRKESVNVIKNEVIQSNYINWNLINKAQRNTKFIVKGNKKQWKLDVDNGDKLFIKKDSDDESILYNDDYNKNDEEMLKRGVKAKILRVKEEESSLSSSSEIDVLANVKITQSNMYKISSAYSAVGAKLSEKYSSGKMQSGRISGSKVIVYGNQKLKGNGACVIVSGKKTGSGAGAVAYYNSNLSSNANADLNANVNIRTNSNLINDNANSNVIRTKKEQIITTTTTQNYKTVETNEKPLEVVLNNTRVITQEINNNKLSNGNININNNIPNQRIAREQIVVSSTTTQNMGNNYEKQYSANVEQRKKNYEEHYSNASNERQNNNIVNKAPTSSNLTNSGQRRQNRVEIQRAHSRQSHQASNQSNISNPESLLRRPKKTKQYEQLRDFDVSNNL